ncbi:hypothetical protein BSKO_09782 [Bryopsis sp. KO-2023]|nr:hypothetical protein BSKO_09782 [Bryopsis sp. KO-2023]
MLTSWEAERPLQNGPPDVTTLPRLAAGNVCVFHRTGKLYWEISLPKTKSLAAPACIQLEWAPSGDKLAILMAGSSSVLVWSVNTKESQVLETGFKNSEVSWLSWSKSKSQLLLGTTKGHILIYNDLEKKKNPVMGKHTKKITCGCWNQDNQFVLGGEDKQITLSDGASGDTLTSVTLSGDPMEACVSQQKTDDSKVKQESTISVCVNQQMLALMQVERDPASGQCKLELLMELVFQEQYGVIRKHLWFGDGYILVGFDAGNMVVISSHRREVGEEIHSGKYLEGGLTDLAYCEALGRVALAGGRHVRIVAVGTEIKELKSEAIELDAQETISCVAWTDDGQVLTVCTEGGQVYGYLCSLPLVNGICNTKILHLTSLQEVCLVDVHCPTQKISIQTKPTVVAIGMNNQVWYFEYDDAMTDAQQFHKKDYLGSIEDIKVNSTCVALMMEGRVLVQQLEGMGSDPNDSDNFDVLPSSQSSNISCFALTEHFVILGSKNGVITYYVSTGLAAVNEYRHDGGGIQKLFPQPDGTQLIFEDNMHNLFLFNPVNDQCITISGFKGIVGKVMWDCDNSNLFVATDGLQLKTYLHVPLSLYGASVKLIGEQTIEDSHVPVSVVNGVVWFQVRNGSLDSCVLHTHTALQEGAKEEEHKKSEAMFNQALKLHLLKESWACAIALKSQKYLQKLGDVAIECMDIELAIAVFRQLGDASKVLSLEQICQYDDKSLVAGHVLVLMGKDIAKAQEELLKSSMPRAALEMRRDLKHWDQALELANQLDPASVPEICKEHAQKLEMHGDYVQARDQYKQAISKATTSGNQEIVGVCNNGIARTTLHLGDVREGKRIAMDIGDRNLCKECAGILENMGHAHDAAKLYEYSGLYERAATIYINIKSFTNAAPLMKKLDPEKNGKLQIQFAKAKEKEGKYEEALEAYQRAGDMNGAVRILLTCVNRPEQACKLVRENPKIEPAAMVAECCKKNGDFALAVEFLQLARMGRQAWEIAEARNEMDAYVEFLPENTSPDEFQAIAEYYEARQEFERAADMFEKAKLHTRAIRMYMQVGLSAVGKAINTVKLSHDRSVASMVLDWVLTENAEGEHQQYIFELYIALGQYDEAAKSSLELAAFEQVHGNYRQAHSQLFTTSQRLLSLGQQLPLELNRALTLLHSYVIVRSQTNLQNHMTGARLLIRVAQNVSKFPAHTVNILVSTVIECHRAGLKETAFEYASMLMRPEYRQQIVAPYKRKIENLVRKPDHEKDVEPLSSECPYCNAPGNEMDLQCHNCQNIIPFCIASGKRMVLSDWSECPSCNFPARALEIHNLLTVQPSCPMCLKDVNSKAFVRIKKLLTPPT